MEAQKKPAKDNRKSGSAAKDDTLQQQLEQAESELQRFKDMAARSQAELQNAKERLRREAEEMRAFAVEGFVRGLLTTIDNFERAFTHLPKELASHDWIKGIQAVEQDFARKLTEAGVTKIPAVGQPVDPTRHEVLQVGPGKEGIVTEVFEEGYELRGKVLRPAKVKVGDGTALDS